MVFTPPSWIEGILIYALIILIPILISIGIFLIGWIKNNEKLLVMGIILLIASIVITIPLSGVIWHYSYEVPSVQSKIITVTSCFRKHP